MALRQYSALGIVLPRVTAQGGLALAQQTIATARSNWKQLPKNVQGAIVKAEDGVVELSATLRAQSNASDGVLRQADLRIDHAWSALVDVFTGLTKLVDHPAAAPAQHWLDIIFDTGLTFINLPYEIEWTESEVRIGRIRDNDFESQMRRFGASVFLDELYAAHAAYGDLLGMNRAKGPIRTKVGDALLALMDRLRVYVTRVLAMVDEDDPSSVELTERLLAPVHQWDVGPRPGGDASPQPPAAPAPVAPVAPVAPAAHAAPVAPAAAAPVAPAAPAPAQGQGVPEVNVTAGK
jgi:hypothetical protein